MDDRYEEADKLKEANKFEEKMANTTNQPPKNQCKTDNTYYEHHLKTGTNTESLVSKPDLAFPSLHFQPGDPVKVWDHVSRRYTIEAVIDSPIIGDDLVPRSYKVVTSDGKMRHVTSAWVVPAAAETE